MTDAANDEPDDGTTGRRHRARTRGSRCGLAERTYSDDEQNLVVLVYATTDGRRYLRKERVLTSFSDVRDTYTAVDEETRAEYAAAARRTAERHGPDDVV